MNPTASYRADLAALHCCVYCGRKDEHTKAGKKQCRACLDKNNARLRKRYASDPAYAEHKREQSAARRESGAAQKAKRQSYQRRKDERRCVVCGQADDRTRKGGSMCAVCCMSHRITDWVEAERHKEERKVKIPRSERFNYGLCYFCGEPLDGQQLKRRRRKQAAPAATKHKTLDECVREADALGISYGEYIRKGLDKT